MTSCSNTPTPCQWFSQLADLLDSRSAPRLIRLFLGAVLAAGRRTVTCWLRAAGISHDFRPAEAAIAAVAKHTDLMAARLARSALRAPCLPGPTACSWASTTRLWAARRRGRPPSQPHAGAGQQQVRFIGANIGAFHLCLWTYTLTETWAWNRAGAELAERSASPWGRK